MQIAKKILGNTAAQVIGKIGSALIAVFTIKILSSYFTTSELGNYGTIFEYLAVFGSLADMGVYTLVLREISKTEEKSIQQKIYNSGFSLRIILISLAMILASILGFLIPSYSGTQIPQGILLAALGTFFVILSGTASVILQYKMQMRYFSYALILGKIIGFIGIYFITQFWIPVQNQSAFYWILLAGTIGSFFIFLFTFLWSKKYMIPKISFQKSELIQMLKSAIPFGIAMILATIYFRTGFLMMHYILPESVENSCMEKFCGDIESGKYLVALRMMEVLLLFPIYFMNSLLPYLTKNIAQKTKKIPKIFSLSFIGILIFALPMAVGGSLLSTELAGIMADPKLLSDGENFGSDSGFMILSISLLFAFLNTFSVFSLIALGKQGSVVWANFSIVIVNIIINLLIIPQYGLMGVGIATVVSEILLWGIMQYMHQKFFPFDFLWKKIFKIFLASSVMGVSILLLKNFWEEENFPYFLGMILFVSPLVYFSVLWGVGVRVKNIIRDV